MLDLGEGPRAGNDNANEDVQEEEDLRARVEQEADREDAEVEDGPDWMFDEGETRSPDTNYEFCPSAHRKQILHLFTTHFCLHPLFPERDGEHTAAEIRDCAVFEMYKFCLRRGLCEVWAYLWMSWYQPSRWKLWARSTSPYLSRLRTTTTVENHWKQLKHEHLHHLVRPRLDQLVWILITEVTPAYVARAEILEDAYRLGRTKPLSTYQQQFKRSWDKLSKQPVSSRVYSVDVEKWTCNCGAQKFHCHHLCKHLVKAVQEPIPMRFWREVYRRRTIPLYQHPSLVSSESETRPYMDPEDGSITDGDDHVYLGDEIVLRTSGWRDFEGGLTHNLRKRLHSPNGDSEHGGTTDDKDEVSEQLQVSLSDNAAERAPLNPAEHASGSEEEAEVRPIYLTFHMNL